MKLNKLLLSSFILAASTSIVYAETGTITFSGNVNASACTIDPSSVNKQVGLSSVNENELNSSGKLGPMSNFSLQLSNCTLGSGANAYSKVSIKFSGTPDTKIGSVWKNTGTATNVGVLFQYGNTVVIPGTTVQQNITAGVNSINLSARMYATGVARAGSVNAVAAYTLSYL